MGKVLEKVKSHRNKVIIINEQNSQEYKEYCLENNIELIDLSLKLSELLSPLSKEGREQEAWDILKEWLESLKLKEVIALNNIDYMFSPEVGNLDPISNFNYYFFRSFSFRYGFHGSVNNLYIKTGCSCFLSKFINMYFLGGFAYKFHSSSYTSFLKV